MTQAGPVGEKGHAMGVGEFYPLEGIGVNGKIPLLELGRANASQQRKVAGDHQALDMMGVSVALRVCYRGGEAVHIRFA